MGFNSFVSSLPHYNPKRSTVDFAGIAEGGGACMLFSNPSVYRDHSVHRTDAGQSESLSGGLAAAGDEICAERKRISRELHDTLLQGFLAVSMQLHAALDDLPEDCAAAKPRISKVLHLLDRVLEQGRRTVQELRSPKEGTSSFGEALANVPRDLELSPAAGFRVVVHGRQKELRTAVREEVYRIGREAIVNACLHSRAADIVVDVEYRATELRVAVLDNGCGIDPLELQWGRDGHWGLQGIRERAERIGARLSFKSRIGLGTEVELRLPARFAFEQ